RPGWAVHQSDFVRQTTGEDDQLILARYDVAIILSWNISVLPSRVVDSQFSPAEFLRLAVEEIHKCDLSRRDFLVGIVVVPAEEITVIAGRDLRLHARDWKRIMAKFREDARQTFLHACSQCRAMPSNIQEHARSPMLKIGPPAVHARRDDFTDVKFRLMTQRVLNQFFKFLRRKKLFQDHAMRWKNLCGLGDQNALGVSRSCGCETSAWRWWTGAWRARGQRLCPRFRQVKASAWRWRTGAWRSGRKRLYPSFCYGKTNAWR